MARCGQVVNTAIQALFLLCVILEPYMPSFSAKVYEQLNIKREAKHETLLASMRTNPELLHTLVAEKHVIGTPEPIFREIKESEGEEWKKMFAGKQAK